MWSCATYYVSLLFSVFDMGQQSNEAKFAALSWMNLDGACEVDSSGYRFRFAARPQLVYQLSYTGILRCSVFTDGRVIIIAIFP